MATPIRRDLFTWEQQVSRDPRLSCTCGVGLFAAVCPVHPKDQPKAEPKKGAR